MPFKENHIYKYCDGTKYVCVTIVGDSFTNRYIVLKNIKDIETENSGLISLTPKLFILNQKTLSQAYKYEWGAVVKNGDNLDEIKFNLEPNMITNDEDGSHTFNNFTWLGDTLMDIKHDELIKQVIVNLKKRLYKTLIDKLANRIESGERQLSQSSKEISKIQMKIVSIQKDIEEYQDEIVTIKEMIRNIN